jgi:hypothetical protein
MKIRLIKRKLIISGLLALILIAATSFLLYIDIEQTSLSYKIYKKITNETSSVKSKISEVRNKQKDFEKFKTLWQKMDESKKNTNGIRIEDVNQSLKKASQRYAIKNPDIKVSLPETLTSSNFKRDTVDIIYTSASLSYSAPSDSIAILFLEDFIRNLHGYAIVTDFQIVKSAEYSPEDLIKLSKGDSSGLIRVNSNFTWYAYKEKKDKRR